MTWHAAMTILLRHRSMVSSLVLPKQPLMVEMWVSLLAVHLELAWALHCAHASTPKYGFLQKMGGIPFHPKSFRYLWLVSYLFMSLPIKCRHQSIMIHDSTTLHVWNGINGYSWGFPISVTAMAAVSAGVAQRSSLDFFRGCWMISSPSKRVSFGARRFTLMPGWRGKPWEKGWEKDMMWFLHVMLWSSGWQPGNAVTWSWELKIVEHVEQRRQEFCVDVASLVRMSRLLRLQRVSRPLTSSLMVTTRACRTSWQEGHAMAKARWVLLKHWLIFAVWPISMSGQAVFASTQLEGAATRRVAQVQEVKDLAQDCSIVICLMDPYIPLCYIMTFISFHILCIQCIRVYTVIH